MAPSTPTPEPIAIVGIGCRFPGGASTPSKLWDLLISQRDIQTTIPSTRFSTPAFHHPDGERPGCLNVSHAYTLTEDITQFDASFFKTNPLEAEAMDPQQRILLETVYEALESAGTPMDRLLGSDTAVYVGSMTGDYHELLLRDPEDMPKYMATGTARSILSNRVSYFFDWKGPSMTIDTACSSSLVAVHEAVQVLRSGVSGVACAAGANLILGPEMMISESKLHMLSPTGRSRMWDENADGYARGEGFSAVILKTLSQARKDGDYVHCVIRETGVNSDGRTNGITLPGSESQTALIRQTYARAGLDIDTDRCQYFEAHGTGTPAGDPIEAKAIYDAFFAGKTGDERKLYVGSVKTAVGHLEGCAGLAGLVKASEAVRRGRIPPNMLFEKLNPDISPFYHRLQVPTAELPWPEMEGEQVRRASVNSFGFGGTNAHAILEAYENHQQQPRQDDATLKTPLVLSANSDVSLQAQIAAFHDLLLIEQDTPVQDILFTMQTRRAQHPVRATFSGHDRLTLRKSLSKALDDHVGTRVDKQIAQPRILGVFTGQGAQWPTMGRELLRTSPLAQHTIHTLQEALNTLPDPPSWSLTDELLADKETSRLGEASVAQPLCTAVQIVLVELLRLVGALPSVVIGHSSGEIGAAYAAGMITAVEAIRIAYYRGVHAKLARGADNQRGAMMAAGMSYDEACDFCEEHFADRLEVAASNAPASVTLSGDQDAIAEAKALLDERGTFARLLLVDTAYHSAHMTPCSEPYLDSLAACAIAPTEARADCVWVSSVHGCRMEGDYRVESLTGEYWNDNMVSPVMFSTAVEVAVTGELPWALHPDPEAGHRGSMPYSGTLNRGTHDVVALSHALGFLWTHLGSAAVDFTGYSTAFGAGPATWVPNLPLYAWDHRQSFWRESTRSRNYRQRPQPRHPLLGVRSTDDIDQDMRWLQTLRPAELPWLDGHRVEGQVIYPAAAYLVMAMEACQALVHDQEEVQLLELTDIEILNAIPLSDDTPGVEVQFTLTPTTSPNPNPNLTTANWACYAHTGPDKASWRCNARGSALIHRGPPSNSPLPPRLAPTGAFNDVDVDRFYEALTEIGLHYTGPFRGLSTVQRRSGTAMATAAQLPSPYTIHPAILDAAFQTIFAAFCWPGDGSLRAPFVPTRLQSLRIVPSAIATSTSLLVDASITSSSGLAITADLDLTDPNTSTPLIQLQSLSCSCLTPPSPADYKELYTQNTWSLDISSGIAPLPLSLPTDTTDSPSDLALVTLCERLSYFYLRHLVSVTPPSTIPNMPWNFQAIFTWLDTLFPWISSGTHPTISPSWASDTKPDLLSLAAQYPESVDLQLIRAVGENLPAVVQNRAWMLEHMVKDDVLDRFYKFGLGFQRANGYMSRVAAQISHRYPRARILEIGAGTGGATKGILEALGGKFERLEGTMRNVRRLVRPGGWLVLLEVTSEIVRVKLMMAGLPGWWLGGEDGRVNGPTITRAEWDALLRKTGWSGVDHGVNDFEDETKYMTSVMVSQAVDQDVRVLREPLGVKGQLAPVGSGEVRLVQGLGELFVDDSSSVDVTTLVVLEDLDQSVLKDFNQAKLQALQRALPNCRHLLWVSSHCRAGDPYGNMAVGLCRGLAAEHPHVQFQHIDLESAVDGSTATVLAEALVRLVFAAQNRKDILWTSEPELMLKDGQVFVPRILPDTRLNDQLNARKMVVNTTAAPGAVVEVLQQGGRYVLAEKATAVVADEALVKVQVVHSLVSAVQLGDVALFVSYGSLVEKPEETVMAFSGSNASVVETRKELVFPVSADGVSLVQTTALALLAEHWLQGLTSSDTIVLHRADEHLGRVVRQRAAEAAIAVADVTVHPFASDKAIRALVPSDAKLLLDFAPSTVWHLPAQCRCHHHRQHHRQHLHHPATASPNLGPLPLSPNSPNPNPNPLSTLHDTPLSSIPYHTTITFPSSSSLLPLPAIARPLNPLLLFRPDQTYLLIGCTGGLGQSLCQWMIANGARHLALTTRSPSTISPAWLTSLRCSGATVTLFQADVTSPASLHSAHAAIKATMPAIAGVANAAMLLSDRSFAQLTTTDFSTVFGPKVTATATLASIFHDTPLDFFIMFSSLASIVGNRGQSNYVSANLFMSTIASQRRARGLAASVFHIGMVLGVGYVSATGIYESTLRQYNYMPISEPEFLDMFAQAIVIGRPSSLHPPELITGLSRHSLLADAKKPFWHENLRFSHHTIAESTTQDTAAGGDVIPLAQSIAEAETVERLDEVIQDAFCRKMERMLQAEKGSVAGKKAQPLINLGVDSLIAVEIRSWFLKELEVDMPVLKLVGGASLGGLCAEAAGVVFRRLRVE
ncbi:ketoacyl-synt-domain-containing protein [Aspergillus heteromorphus CBS 117.55]|uniref:Ketoacyl-synt-domain-containing protein n=1 Tax=Aspergillus heteromorphus CBS 117.55 TaxID=1448321 RepID=A0A317W370_9EURO|nr:ketoacyl-synt-domain-containing protein [Aspergillus heteromorphus CBS 117.55]PWY79697.1 ketoacyl-synt-domain-containing protein [Aspergillus heteromorphus CBS 117.55]